MPITAEVKAMNDKVRPLNKYKGQSMVEFALVFPVLLVFFIGIMQLGFLINDYIAINRAVAETCRFGSTLVGYSSAEVLIVGKLLDSLGENIKKEHLKIVSFTSQKYGPYYKNVYGQLVNSNGQNVNSFDVPLFFRSDNNSPNNFSDDLAVRPSYFDCSYVSVRVEYAHQVIIPFADLINASTVPLKVSSTWPVSAYYPNLLPVGQFKLEGAMPITVNENICTFTGAPVTIKGDWLTSGGFGWLDLSVYYDSGFSPSAGPTELAAWISNPLSAAVKISAPQNVYSTTGSKSASNMRTALNSLIGRKMLIPIYDYTGGTGSNTFYHIVGFAVFKLNGVQDYPDLTVTYIKTIGRAN